MKHPTRGNIAFPFSRRTPTWTALAALGSIALPAPGGAMARTPQENHVELQAFRYSRSSIGLESARKSGGTEKRTLRESAFATFPNRVTFLGHAGPLAFQLTRAFNEGGSGYLAAGYVFSELFEAGLGANLLWRDYERLDDKGQEYDVRSRGYFFGPYALVNIPVDFGEVELRWEIDYGLSREERKGSASTVKLGDARGYETDFDARVVYRASPKLAFTTGANVFYKSTEDKAPASTAYAKVKRTDLTFGLNVVGARFNF